MNKKELRKKIEEIEITYDYEETYTNLINTVIDYMNETQDFSLDYLFEDFMDEYSLEELVKYKVENEGIWSVRNLLSETTNNGTMFKIDAYGYAHDIDKEDLELLKEEILDNLEED